MPDAAFLSRRLRRSHAGDPSARRADERELALLYQRDPGARDEVVRALAPLARSVARRYRYSTEPREDLEQVAMVGLVKALRGFDDERCRSFAAYAFPTIAGELCRHFRDTGWAVHVPRGLKELARNVSKAEQGAGHVPDARESAATLGVPVDDVFEGRRAALAMRAESLSQPSASDDGDGSRPATTAFGADDPSYAAVENRVTIGALTRELGEREREVLALRFGRELTQAEIGRQVGVSQMQVSRILRAALARLDTDAAVGA